MTAAIADDRLIHVYGGGGHTTLVMGEMFFRAGGLANINPIMETGLSVFNQALKSLALARWQAQMPPDHCSRQPNKKNRGDRADGGIDDYNEVGDGGVRVPGFDTPIA